MCCESRGHRGGQHQGHHHEGSCCCGGPVHSGMCFATREEKVSQLTQYLEGLRKEAEAVKERIAKLEAEG